MQNATQEIPRDAPVLGLIVTGLTMIRLVPTAIRQRESS
jgi:hypothetical protein